MTCLKHYDEHFEHGNMTDCPYCLAEELRAELAEAREDSRRLDTLQRWLDSLLVLEILFEPDTQMTVIPDQNDSIDNMGADDIRVSGDLRAAIDAGKDGE
jgi:hypothetical protein